MWNKTENVFKARLNRIMLVVGLRQKAQRTGGRRFQLACAGRVVLGSLVCAAIVMCATSARAQEHEHPKVTRTVVNETDFPFGDEDKCTTPFSIIAGLGHFHSEVETRSDFINDYTIEISQHGTGTNVSIAADTAPYKFNYSDTYRFRSPTPNFTFTTSKVRKRMIRQGSLSHPFPSWLPSGKDDYFFYEKITVSPISPPSRNSDKIESTCK